LRLGIKAKQVLAIASIVGLAVVVLSALYLSAIARVSLNESRERGLLLVNSIFHRARLVVPTRGDLRLALRDDPGLRSIVESSMYSGGVTYAAIVDVDGVAIVHNLPGEEGRPLAEVRELDDLLGQSGFSQFQVVNSRRMQIFEVREKLLLRGQDFGSIRVGISTALVKSELDKALQPAFVTAAVALLVATLVAMFFAQVILRPIHVIRGGLSRLARGEFGVKLDLPQSDEFGELGAFFNNLSAQLSADRLQLAGQKAKLESVVDHLEDAVAIFNPDGELLFANPAMRATLSPDTFGRPVDDVLPAGHPYREAVVRALMSGQSHGPMSAVIGGSATAQAEGDATTANGGEVTDAGERLVMTHAIRDLDQHLVGVMLVARNLEYLGRVQSTINYSRKLVALGRLSAGVAHEVKNPLNAMTIHLELLKQKLLKAGRATAVVPATRPATGPLSGALDPPRAVSTTVESAAAPEVSGALEHVRIIASEIKRLDEVVQGFLKFTRPEDLRLQPVDLPSLVDEVIRVVEPEARAARVTLAADCPPDVPDINGDPAMLRQAFLNLALNACQAMPAGGSLRIACAPARGRRVQVTFEDTGVGIKPDHLSRIFDLYFTTKQKGSGIGLSMVYRIVQLHDGDIEVQSVEGRGTTFRLTLPQA
jgi:signal transduction histidine kinase